MAGEHTVPCSAAQVLVARVDAQDKRLDGVDAMRSELSEVKLLLVQLTTKTDTRLDYIEAAQDEAAKVVKDHVASAAPRIEKIEKCDDFRKNAAWGIGILFAAVTAQCVAMLFKRGG